MNPIKLMNCSTQPIPKPWRPRCRRWAGRPITTRVDLRVGHPHLRRRHGGCPRRSVQACGVHRRGQHARGCASRGRRLPP